MSGVESDAPRYTEHAAKREDEREEESNGARRTRAGQRSNEGSRPFQGARCNGAFSKVNTRYTAVEADEGWRQARRQRRADMDDNG